MRRNKRLVCFFEEYRKKKYSVKRWKANDPNINQITFKFRTVKLFGIKFTRINQITLDKNHEEWVCFVKKISMKNFIIC
jgi:hypothetical protein